MGSAGSDGCLLAVLSRTSVNHHGVWGHDACSYCQTQYRGPGSTIQSCSRKTQCQDIRRNPSIQIFLETKTSRFSSTPLPLRGVLGPSVGRGVHRQVFQLGNLFDAIISSECRHRVPVLQGLHHVLMCVVGTNIFIPTYIYMYNVM